MPMDQSDVEHLERLLNAMRPRWYEAQGFVLSGDYKRARHAIDRLHALLTADARRTLTRSTGDFHAIS